MWDMCMVSTVSSSLPLHADHAFFADIISRAQLASEHFRIAAHEVDRMPDQIVAPEQVEATDQALKAYYEVAKHLHLKDMYELGERKSGGIPSPQDSPSVPGNKDSFIGPHPGKSLAATRRRRLSIVLGDSFGSNKNLKFGAKCRGHTQCKSGICKGGMLSGKCAKAVAKGSLKTGAKCWIHESCETNNCLGPKGAPGKCKGSMVPSTSSMVTMVVKKVGSMVGTALKKVLPYS